jgi:hypothetical protein
MNRSEYDPVFAGRGEDVEDDLGPVRERFRAASRPYLRSPWSWLAWAVVLPAAALATPWADGRGGPSWVLFVWSAAILAGGAVEGMAILKGGGSAIVRTPLAGWALGAQGNLSLIGVILSALLIWNDLAWALPGLWLVLVGHSFYRLGGLASNALRGCGLIFQAGGVAALWAGASGSGEKALQVFAGTAFAGALWMAAAILRRRRD